MTLDELIQAYRTRAKDRRAPYLWSDDEIVLYLNEAEAEAAERGSLLVDRATPAVCEIHIDSSSAEYPLHGAVLKIQRATIDGLSGTLKAASRAELDERSPGWELETGTPTRYIDEEGVITFYPRPTAAMLVRIHVVRLPIRRMSIADPGRGPEIHERWQFPMLNWALRCGYLKKDADTFNLDEASRHEAMFTASFGERLPADVLTRRRSKPRSVTKYRDF